MANSIVLILHFTGRELVFSEYTTLDMGRQHNSDTHINATNQKLDLAFHSVFEQITEYLGDDLSFAVTIKTEEADISFADIVADYYLTTHGETLHFGKRLILQEEQEQQQESETMNDTD